MRTRAALALGLLFAALACAGCGQDEPSPAARTRAALGEIFLLAAFADPDRLAPRIVYRGPDAPRRWKDVCDASDPDERAHVRRLGARVTALLGAREPEFVTFRSETESEGTWLVWTVRGANGTAQFACLEIDGVIALGDMERD